MKAPWLYLEDLNEPIYVADPENYSLVYMNRCAMEIFSLKTEEDYYGKVPPCTPGPSISMSILHQSQAKIRLFPGMELSQPDFRPVSSPQRHINLMGRKRLSDGDRNPPGTRQGNVRKFLPL